MPTANFAPGEFVELISYDLFVTGIGFGLVSGYIRLTYLTTLSDALAVASGFLATLALLSYRLSSSIKERMPE